LFFGGKHIAIQPAIVFWLTTAVPKVIAPVHNDNSGRRGRGVGDGKTV